MFWAKGQVVGMLALAAAVVLGGSAFGAFFSTTVLAWIVGWFGLEVPFSLMMLGFFLFYCLSLIVIGFFGD